jgi:hypothetical protein
MALESHIRTQLHPLGQSHNPKVAGSNPAPAMTPLATMPARSSRSEVVLKAVDMSAFSRIWCLLRLLSRPSQEPSKRWRRLASVSLDGIRVEELPLPKVLALDLGHPRAIAHLAPLGLDDFDLVVDNVTGIRRGE